MTLAFLFRFVIAWKRGSDSQRLWDGVLFHCSSNWIFQGLQGIFFFHPRAWTTNPVSASMDSQHLGLGMIEISLDSHSFLIIIHAVILCMIFNVLIYLLLRICQIYWVSRTRRWVVSNIFFPPRKLGVHDSQFDGCIFLQMGWSNHQPKKTKTCRGRSVEISGLIAAMLFWSWETSGAARVEL